MSTWYILPHRGASKNIMLSERNYTQRPHLHDSVQMKYLEQRNLQSQEVDEWLSRAEGGEVEAAVGDGKGYRVSFWDHETFLKLTVVMVKDTYNILKPYDIWIISQ